MTTNRKHYIEGVIMSIHTEEDDLKMQRSLNDLHSGLDDDFEIEVTVPPGGVLFGRYNGTYIVSKKYFVTLGMGESPITDVMVKDRSIFYSWANHPMFKIGDGSARIDGKYLFPKKILINYDRNSVEMDFEMFEIVEKGTHVGYVAKPDNATMEFEHAYTQRSYKIDRIAI